MTKGHWVYIARDSYPAATNSRCPAGTVIDVVAGTLENRPEIGREGEEIFALVFMPDDPNGIYNPFGLKSKSDRLNLAALKAALPSQAAAIDKITDSAGTKKFKAIDAPVVDCELAITTVIAKEP